jgi:hypothetical protein
MQALAGTGGEIVQIINGTKIRWEIPTQCG